MSSLLPAPYRYILLVLTLALCGGAGVRADTSTEVTQHEYDANGNLILTEDPLGDGTRNVDDVPNSSVRLIASASGQGDTVR